MVDLLSLQKQFILAHLREGDCAVDFTMGNGYDTVFLSKTVGPRGKVTAFDIQPDALFSTEKNLRANACPDNWRLICASHDRAPEFVKAPIRAGMFNLGYLPGSGRKQLTTMRSTTLPAVERALAMLGEDAVLLVAVYPGHPEGDREREELTGYLANLPPQRYNVLGHKFLNAGPGAPECFVVQKQRVRAPDPMIPQKR